jgi:hypothetical protein
MLAQPVILSGPAAARWFVSFSISPVRSSREHLMGDSPADGEMLCERAFVD